MNRLKEVRKQKGLRLVDLSKMTGVSIGWIWAMENDVPSTMEVKKRLATILNVPVCEIFPSEDKPSPDSYKD